MRSSLLLTPTPHRLTDLGGHSPWVAENAFLPLDRPLAPLRPALQRFLAEAEKGSSRRWRLLGESERRAYPGTPHALIGEDRSLPAEGYRLCLGANGISLFCRTWQGGFYGLQTLRQILAQCPDGYPHLEIEDAPARPHRGFMLDLSRCRVPKQEELFRLIDRLAALKYNQLQLYLEHTFAFPGHRTVWGDASPLTAAEIRALDAYAAERAIELVPNFNSFGHFERWLRHPEYFQYAECPYGWRRPDGHGMPWSSTLAPGPRSRDFLAGLYRDYLPLFESRQCNLGGDEPWELGMGRSRVACEREGKHAVYLDFLHEIVDEASAHKDRVQFWADIVLERPEVVSRLDPRLIGLVWGYEAEHPLAEQAAIFAAQGLDYYLCPGTSSWNSLGSRLDNARRNIEQAGRAAEDHAASGLLLTEWGDYGHHQPLLVTLPALLLSSQAGWAPRTPLDDLAARLTACAFPSDPGLADALLRLGRFAEHFAFRPPNRMPLVAVLSARQDQLPGLAAPLADAELTACRAAAAALIEDLEALAPSSFEAARDREEIALCAALLRHAAERLLASRGSAGIPAPRLRADFISLIGRFEAAWVSRSRVGGLHESSEWLRRALATYPSDPASRPSWPPTAWD